MKVYYTTKLNIMYGGNDNINEQFWQGKKAI